MLSSGGMNLLTVSPSGVNRRSIRVAILARGEPDF